MYLRLGSWSSDFLLSGVLNGLQLSLRFSCVLLCSGQLTLELLLRLGETIVQLSPFGGQRGDSR